MKVDDFNVGRGVKVIFIDLRAIVKVRSGKKRRVRVKRTGDAGLLEQITVTKSKRENVITIRGQGDSGSLTIKRPGRTVTSSAPFTYIEGGVRAEGDFVGGDKIIGDKIVGDKIIGDKIAGDVSVGGEIPTITVTVPAGTYIEFEQVERSDVRGVGGYVKTTLTGSTKVADITGAHGIEVVCRNSAKVFFYEASGGVNAEASSSGQIYLEGDFAKVVADASDSGVIDIQADVEELDLSSTDYGRIEFEGDVSGDFERFTDPSGKINVH